MTNNKMIPKTMPLNEVFENYKRYYKKFYEKCNEYNNIPQSSLSFKVHKNIRKYKHMLNFFKFIAYNEYDILILGIEDDEIIFRCTYLENDINNIDNEIENSMNEYDEELKEELKLIWEK